MTNAERHEARYHRRKAARDAKRWEKVKDAQDFDSVFSFKHLYNSALACYKGVGWKASVQAYKSRGGINVAKKYEELKNGEIRIGKCPEFTVRERGRVRQINSIGIVDRVPQKCNSKYALKPVLHRSLIYDNYASQENKGTTLARARLEKNLRRHIRKYGLTGGIITLDLHHFFDSIRHDVVEKLLDENFIDKRIVDYNMRIVRNGKRIVGLVLGSENSQDFAVSVPNPLDHFAKENLRVDSYGRYMDDICIIHHDYEALKTVFVKIKDFLKDLGLTLNEKKSRLIRFGKQFSMLKRKYDFTETGHIIIRPARESVIRERRKLKRLHRRIMKGELPFKTAVDSIQAWKASIAGTRCRKIIKSMEDLFNRLFIEPWLSGAERRQLCTTS